MTDIKELRSFTGLNQEHFAKKYHIPLQSLKQWESRPGSKSYRKPPEYVNYLLEQNIMNELTNRMIDGFLALQNRESESVQKQALVDAAHSIWG